jgi:hypothetical protein
MSLELERMRTADRVVAVGGLALLVSMFLFNWYGTSIVGLLPSSRISGATFSLTGWEAFTSSRWIWLLTGVMALGSVLAAARSYRLEGPVQLSTIVLGLGAVSSGLILYRIIHHPGASISEAGLHLSYGIRFGIWLGLAAALTVAFGGYLQSLPEGATGSERAAGPPAGEPDKGEGEGEDAGSGEAFSGLTVREQRAPAAGGQPPDAAQ